MCKGVDMCPLLSFGIEEKKASPATHRGAPSQHLAGPLPGPAWHQIRPYPETWLEPYLDAHLSYTCRVPSLSLSYT